MRKIEISARDAFFSGEAFKLSNTEVRVTSKHVELFLHGNKIASRTKAGNLVRCSLSGWNTNTTKSRLRALGADIKTRNGKVFANGFEVTVFEWFYL